MNALTPNRPTALIQSVAPLGSGKASWLQPEAPTAAACNGIRYALHYQPICRVRGCSGRAWVEFLVRGLGETAGAAPLELVAQAWRALGTRFDLDVIDRALTCARALAPTTRIGVNVHPGSLQDDGFATAVARRLAAHAIDPTRLVLELVEFQGPVDLEASRAALTALRRLGVRIALDDFGPGFPNLDLVAAGLVDVIKLDRSLVQMRAPAQAQTALLAGVVALARSTGLEVVAEGVETPAHLGLVRASGIEWVQGFLLGRPTPTRVTPLDPNPIARSTGPRPQSNPRKRLS